MDKNGKLQRYDRKDYSELVDFPVEIVGRDGVVRRYTFEDSIRLYQRRITFAPIRYRDPDLIRAEANHCRSRIDQLRRSYFHRYGWGTREGQAPAEQCFGDLAGELAAFLCRVLGVEGRPDVRFDELASEVSGRSIWFVTPPEQGLGRAGWAGSSASLRQRGMILYFYRFEGPEHEERRDAFCAAVKDLEQMGTAGDAEKLVASHQSVDCGFVLTGRAADHPMEVIESSDSRPVEIAPTPWDEVLEMVNRGEHEAALRRCRDLVREQPWHRQAYVTGAMLAAFLGEHVIGEDLALVGSRYFPDDGPVHHYLGLCRYRLGRRSEAEAALRRALELEPSSVSARMLLVIQLIQSRRHGRAWELLHQARSIEPDDKRANDELQQLAHWMRWRLWMLGAGAAAVGLGLVGVTIAQAVGLALILLGVFLWGLGWFAFQRQLDLIASRQRLEEIGTGLRRLQRQHRAEPVVS